MKATINKIKGLIAKTILIATVVTIPIKAAAQNTSLITIDRETAINRTVNVPVWAGRSTIIDFTKTGEIITYILLADPSRTVINTDATLDSQKAKTIFLKVIQPLRFPGATTRFITNLSVKTRSPDGEEQIYTFNIVPNYGQVTNNGITISPFSPYIEQRILVSGNRVATLSDIETGLRIAINRGYTDASDPIIFRIKEFLALARNSMPIAKAAAKAKVSLSVITALGEISLDYLNDQNMPPLPPNPETPTIQIPSSPSPSLPTQPPNIPRNIPPSERTLPSISPDPRTFPTPTYPRQTNRNQEKINNQISININQGN